MTEAVVAGDMLMKLDCRDGVQVFIQNAIRKQIFGELL